MLKISVYVDTILKSSDFRIDSVIYFLVLYEEFFIFFIFNNKDIQDDQRYYSILYIRICKRRCP